MNKKKEQDSPLLFPDMAVRKKVQDKIRKDEMNFALLPFVHFPGKRSPKQLYEKVIPIDEFRQVKLISSKAGGGIPEGNDLDYFYALMDFLYEQTNFEDDTIYFFITELILKAKRKISRDEIQRAIRAIKRFRHLVVQSNTLLSVSENGTVGYSEDDISYIQHFTIVGEKLQRGRRAASDNSQGGKCMVVFSKFFMRNITSEELSKPLNYSLMMKLKNSKGKKLFRMIDAFRHRDSFVGKDHYEMVSKEITDIARRIPLNDAEISKVSLIQRSIDPIHDELKELAYLSDYFYEQLDKKVHIVYVFSKFKTDQASAYNELIAKGITAKVAEELAMKYSPEHIMDVIKYSEYKKEEKSVITPGYIRNTIMESNHEWIKAFLAKKQEEKKQERLKDAFKVREKLKLVHDMYIESKVDEAIAGIDNKSLDQLKQEIEAEFANNPVRPSTRATKDAAIEGVLRTRLKETLGLPPFEQWLNENKDRYSHLIS